MILPARLRAGARIALVAPAGPLAEGAVDRAEARVRELGWEPIVGPSARKRSGYLAGSDAERVADFNAALRSMENDAIWCLRGGYGNMRILPELELSRLRDRPRPLIGFSDNTALHLALQRLGVMSFHGPHAATENFPPFAARGLLSVTTNAVEAGYLPFPDGSAGRAETLVGGVATGRLIGGNLSLVAATVGTPYQIQPEGSILFLEEVGEPSYRIDRMLTQLLLAGIFDGIAGIAIGAISECPDTGTPHLPEPRAVLLDRLERLKIPLAFGFPIGHVPENWTIPMGVLSRLDASAGTLEILEPAVIA
jgi:muramoyltetrapeptide carboxypeptidase